MLVLTTVKNVVCMCTCRMSDELLKYRKKSVSGGQNNPACTTVYLNLTYIHQRTPTKSYKERVYISIY